MQHFKLNISISFSVSAFDKGQIISKVVFYRITSLNKMIAKLTQKYNQDKFCIHFGRFTLRTVNDVKDPMERPRGTLQYLWGHFT